MTANSIHPTAIIEQGARLGTRNVIGPYCYVGPTTVIGSGNRLEAFVSVGTPPEHREWFGSYEEGVVIGDNCTIREFVTVNCGIDRPTRIGDEAILLAKAYVGHDSILEAGVTLACSALIGGRCHLMVGCNVGLGAAVHQMQVIGAYAMIGMNATIPRTLSVDPFMIFVGSPARSTRENVVGIERAGLSEGDIAALRERFTALRAAGDHWVVDRP